MSSFYQMPAEVYNHNITFRPTHPVAKLIRDFKGKFSYCIVCYEKERVPRAECCSSDCYRQFADNNYYTEYFDGYHFRRFMEDEEKFEK